MEEDLGDGRPSQRPFDIRVVKLGDGLAVSWRDVLERRRMGA